MPQNLYMEDESLTLYVDVQPLFIDSLENSKKAAAASAQAASQSEQNASSILSSISQYKANIELFYAQAQDNLAIFYNTYKNELISTKNTAAEAIQNLKNTVLSTIDATFRNALNLLQQTGQNIINQAKDYADQAKDAVDNRVSLEHLNQSKALITGMVSNDNDVLTDIISYAHSTFDLSKFTVVGSPTITNDGIASGFGDSNYVTAPTITLGNNFKLYLPFTLPNTISATQIYRMQKDSAFRFLLTIGRGLNVYFNLQDDNGVNSSNLNILDGNEGVAGDSYIAIIELKNGTLTYGYIHNGVYTSKGTPVTTALNFTTAINNFLIGRGGSEGYNGSIDLKQFSITVEGVEVFSGNKTGVDTIKSDDYTVVGSPTISVDGVASGFSSSNYLTTNLTFTPKTKIEVWFKYTTGNDINTNQWGYRFSNDLLGNEETIGIGVNGGKFKISLKHNVSYNWIDCSANTTYIIKMVFTSSSTIAEIYSKDGTLIDSYTYTTAPILMQGNNSQLTIGASTGSLPFLGSIDLNAFKVYVDGDLVYQPCLKIPYTESKTGSKIVDAVYRSRVNDMAEQIGYANYYTLDEINGNFTLPQGELYGMIENLRTMIQQLSE